MLNFILFSLYGLYESKLLKTVILARHGNRTPDPSVPYICPNLIKTIQEFDLATILRSHQGAGLTSVGIAENYEAGQFIRETYGDLLFEPGRHGEYFDDGKTYFVSERMNRNLQSLVSLVNGIYPVGYGPDGVLDHRPNVVPFITTPPFRDTILDAQDGPCKPQYGRLTRASFTPAMESKIKRDNLPLLKRLSTACGFDLINGPGEKWNKPFAWTMKAVSDALNMAKNEGLDYTIGGRLSTADSLKTISIGTLITTYNRFGSDEIATFWVGRFLNVVFTLLDKKVHDHDSLHPYIDIGANTPPLEKSVPFADDRNDFFNRSKLFVFLTHREVMLSLCRMFAINEYTNHPLPTASMLLWELHEDEENNGEHYIIFKTWKPSDPTWEEKNHAHKTKAKLQSLFSKGGEAKEIKLSFCQKRHDNGCYLEEFIEAYTKWTKRTGTFDQICKLDTAQGGDVLLTSVDMAKAVHKWLRKEDWERDLEDHIFHGPEDTYM